MHLQNVSKGSWCKFEKNKPEEESHFGEFDLKCPENLPLALFDTASVTKAGGVLTAEWPPTNAEL